MTLSPSFLDLLIISLEYGWNIPLTKYDLLVDLIVMVVNEPMEKNYFREFAQYCNVLIYFNIKIYGRKSSSTICVVARFGE
jgi:hypothetical protein